MITKTSRDDEPLVQFEIQRELLKHTNSAMMGAGTNQDVKMKPIVRVVKNVHSAQAQV